MGPDSRAEREAAPPALMFSHFGMYCADVAKLEDFYTRVLGFAVSDSGEIAFGDDEDPISIVFMTRRPREHHQFVLAGGRAPGTPSTIGEIGFKAPDLDELRRIKAVLLAEEGVGDIVTVDHGIAWTLYFRDAEGNRVSVAVETGLYVPQPSAWPLDLDDRDVDIRRTTEERAEATPGSMPRKAWRKEKEREFRADHRLTDEGPETGRADPGFPRPTYPGRVLLRTAEGTTPPPRVALGSVGFTVHDLDLVSDFYQRVLGYAVTGHGLMPPLGDEPAREYVYLSRDPDEHQQVVLVSGRDLAVPSSVNQLSLRVTSLDELRRMAEVLEGEPGAGPVRGTCHGNSFSMYFPDPEGNVVELAVESTWYVPAPHGAPLDLSMTDEQLVDWAERHCYETPGFMMRADWKAQARDELVANGHLEAEGLVSTVA